MYVRGVGIGYLIVEQIYLNSLAYLLSKCQLVFMVLMWQLLTFFFMPNSQAGNSVISLKA